MSSTIAKVGSTALTELKNDLTQLSKTLLVIYDLMNADMRQIGEAWQDGQYQQFVQDYQPQIQKCEEIANRYTEWCTRVLEPTIQNVVAVETTDVSNGAVDGSVGSAVVGGAVVGVSTGVAAANGFNMDNKRPVTKIEPIFNGCGSELSETSRTLGKLGPKFEVAMDKLHGRPYKGEDYYQECCRPHDKGYHHQEGLDKVDGEFSECAPNMAYVVSHSFGINKNSYKQAGIDKELSEQLKPQAQEEHQICVDSDNFYVRNRNIQDDILEDGIQGIKNIFNN